MVCGTVWHRPVPRNQPVAGSARATCSTLPSRSRSPLDTAAGCRQVVHGVVQVGDGGLETVLGRTQQAALVVNRFDRRIDVCQRAAVSTTGGVNGPFQNVEAFSGSRACRTVDGLASRGRRGACRVVQVVRIRFAQADGDAFAVFRANTGSCSCWSRYRCSAL